MEKQRTQRNKKSAKLIVSEFKLALMNRVWSFSGLVGKTGVVLFSSTKNFPYKRFVSNGLQMKNISIIPYILFGARCAVQEICYEKHLLI